MPDAGRYGVVQTGGWIGRLIRWGTHSWANHAFICLGGDQIIGAMPNGVVLGSLAEYTGAPIAFNTDEPMTDAQREAVVNAAKGMIGYSYDFADIGALAIESLGWHWRLAFRIAGIDKRSTICSQLVANCGMQAGLDSWLCGKSEALDVTPADLARRPYVERA